MDEGLASYAGEYRAYFDRHNGNLEHPKTALDPMPRVVLVRGLGLFALGSSYKAAEITADLAETTINVISDSECVGKFESITESEIFQIEYWSLEQAKFGKVRQLPLSGHVVVITGGGRCNRNGDSYCV